MDEETAKSKPVLLTLMTVSNHRPYKFPQTVVKWDERMGRIQNTTRYAQWAFVDFIERARQKPWFAETVFVFVGGSGTKVNGAAVIPVHSFRIPLLFYAPKYIKPGRNETLGAQIDLTPTLPGLLGISYDNPFFGVDLRRVKKGQGRITIAHNFSIAYGRPAISWSWNQMARWEATTSIQVSPICGPRHQIRQFCARPLPRHKRLIECSMLAPITGDRPPCHAYTTQPDIP
jgi:phosphoglycerol transferase MdoB-like AlkP superfamily enzyme